MSNRRKLPREIPAGIAATAKAAKCSDCNGRAQARYKGSEWSIKFWHSEGCPAFTRTTVALHQDAAASVQRAAEATGTELIYEVISDAAGFVSGAGLVTAPARAERPRAAGLAGDAAQGTAAARRYCLGAEPLSFVAIR